MIDDDKLKASARCSECSGYFTIECTPLCEQCFVNKLKISVVTSRKKRWHIDARKFAYQAVIVMPTLAAVQHYMGSEAQIVCGAAYILGNVMNSLTDWLAHKI